MGDSPEENRRRTHANSINRIKAFVHSNEFGSAGSLTLAQKREFLEKAFADFSEEHLRFLQWLPRERFQEQDELFSTVERLYQDLIVKIRMQFAEMEAKELTKRLEERKRKGDSTTDDSERESENERKKRSNWRLKSKINCTDTQPHFSHQKRESETQPHSPRKTHGHSTQPLFSGKAHGQSYGRTQPHFSVKAHVRPTQPQFSSRDVRERLSQKLNNVRERGEWRSYGDLREQLNGGRKSNPSIICNGCDKKGHPISKCQEFLDMNVPERREHVKNRNLCVNCLQRKPSNGIHRCKAGSCHRCGDPQQFTV